jgi:hypothetical protein
MSEWFFFMTAAERRDALVRLLEENSAALVSGRLHTSREVPRFVGLLPDDDIDGLFPNGVVYLLPPSGSELVVEPVGDTGKFKISELKGGPHSRITLPRHYPAKRPATLNPGVLSRNAEFWDSAIKRRFPVTAEFKSWHESLKKTLQRQLRKVGRVWISASALGDIRSGRVVPVLAQDDLKTILKEEKKAHPVGTDNDRAAPGRV